MKRSMLPAASALVLIVISSVIGQDYSIDWHTIDGGGDTRTGGVFTVSGTNYPVTIPATLPTKFYRLHKP